MKETELKPCPFCGGAAIFKETHIYIEKGYVVKCVQCDAKTTVVLVDHPKFTANGLDESTRYTEEQAKEKAAEKWNRRATDGEEAEAHWYIREYEYFTCSECGHDYYNGCDSTKEAKERLADGEYPNFCSYCGARMKGA